jgi:hypothetical protein
MIPDTDRARFDGRLPRQRSRVSNGRLSADIDGRSAMARRFRDLIDDLACDLGGAVNLSTAELAVVRQAAALTLRAEQLQSAIVRGESIDADEAVRLANASARLLASLRNKQRVKPAVPNLRDYLATKAAAKEPEAAGEKARHDA